ncbi:MAG: AhpC/TSA family protein [Opitutus sp.]|nr:AhpC/TSA family protein [Opitutus sp.]
MKRLSSLVVFILTAGFLHAATGYVVNGRIAGLPDGPIKLQAIFDGAVLAETTAKSGAFTFKQDGEFVGNHVYLAANGLKRVDFYLEPGTITLEGTATGGTTASGTLSNDTHNLYLKEIAPTETRMAEIRVQLRTVTDAALKAKLTAELDHQYSGVYYPFRRSFAYQHNKTILAAEFLSAGTGQLTYADFKELLSKLDPATPTNWYTDRLKERCEILRTTDFSQVAPDFTLPDPAGRQISLSSLKGSYVLVDFWASWCAPCRQENQNVKKLYAKYHAAGFDVISVSIDESREKWLKAIEEDKLPWHHVSSLTGWKCPVANRLGVAYGMSGIPYTLLLDREGKVVGHNVRGESLERKLAEFFGAVLDR